MLRLLETELKGAVMTAPDEIPRGPFSIATGVAAAPSWEKSLTERRQMPY